MTMRESDVAECVQNVLQFQSRGTLAAISGPRGSIAPSPGPAEMGVEGVS